ncbi:hypothetical protein, partial [Kitasatospora purpeofusca]|uniref:hypothetical protein n=1 Tax=Kitasatospora purpeofusca TaxID=67352 RepID=UPI00364DCC13
EPVDRLAGKSDERVESVGVPEDRPAAVDRQVSPVARGVTESSFVPGRWWWRDSEHGKAAQRIE